MPPQYKLSVVIPTWENDFQHALDLLEKFTDTPEVQWIISSYNPPENWQELVQKIALTPEIVICERAGRGIQLNEGAKYARGQLLAFNHADTLLEPEHLASLLQVDTSLYTAGSFHRILLDKHQWLCSLDPAIRWYNQHFGILFGDQTVFITKQEFNRLGGFKPIKLMEDVEFSSHIRKECEIILITPPILSSGRRLNEMGIFRVTSLNLLLLLLFRCGVCTTRLYELYYSYRRNKQEHNVSH